MKLTFGQVVMMQDRAAKSQDSAALQVIRIKWTELLREAAMRYKGRPETGPRWKDRTFLRPPLAVARGRDAAKSSETHPRMQVSQSDPDVLRGDRIAVR